MTDSIEIGNESELDWGVECGLDMGLAFEACFELEEEPLTATDDSEIHLIVGDLVEEPEAGGMEYDFGMEFAGAETAFVYVGPELPGVDATWSTDAWFRSDGWFDSEGW